MEEGSGRKAVERKETAAEYEMGRWREAGATRGTLEEIWLQQAILERHRVQRNTVSTKKERVRAWRVIIVVGHCCRSGVVVFFGPALNLLISTYPKPVYDS